MPNWNYNKMTFSATTENGKKQLHQMVDKHFKINDEVVCDTFGGEHPQMEIDGDSIIPIPDGIKRHSEMVAKRFNDPPNIEDHDKMIEAEKALAAENIEKYGCGDEYDFCCDYWGSKWGFCDSYCEPDVPDMETLHKIIDTDGRFSVFTQCAWGPATGLMKKLCELYPDIDFQNEWGEEQVTEYYGIMHYSKKIGFVEEDIRGQELWDMLATLGLIEYDTSEYYLDDDGKIQYNGDDDGEDCEDDE